MACKDLWEDLACVSAISFSFPFLEFICFALQDSESQSNFHNAGDLEEPKTHRYAYRCTVSVLYTMTLINYEIIIGSTMGSHKDLIDATNFMVEHRIVPVVSHVLDGLESAEEGFELMKRGDQFGKIVIKIRESEGGTKAKL
jgi:hypothetical protein